MIAAVLASDGHNRIVVARTAEVSQVAALLGEFHDHLEKPRPPADELEDSVRHVMEGGDGVFLLGYVGEEPAGFVQLRWRWAVWTRALDGWLEDVFVAEANRGSGLGRDLVAAAIERARELGCARLELDVNEDNEPALGLYRALGFTDTSKGRSRSLLLGLRPHDR